MKKKAAKKRATTKAVAKAAAGGGIPSPVGRPTAFRPEFEAAARKLCLMGATDRDLAEAFSVDERTINNWKDAHPEFFQSIKDAKAALDDQVEKSLFQRATGYSHDAVRILTVPQGDNQGSIVESVPYTQHYPPDSTALIFWLKNRRPDQWRDKHEVDHNVVGNLAALMREAEERVNHRQ